jgi:hypothetical protein
MLGGDASGNVRMLWDVVEAAGNLVEQPTQTVDAESVAQDEELVVDAVLWELGWFTVGAMIATWPGIPAAALDFGRYDEPPGDNGEILDQVGMNFDERVGVIARWLASTREAEVTAGEREMLEVLLDRVQRVLDNQTETNESVAQVQAATDTIQAQLRAPSPSRRVLGWAVSQISTYAVGVASDAALRNRAAPPVPLSDVSIIQPEGRPHLERPPLRLQDGAERVLQRGWEAGAPGRQVPGHEAPSPHNVSGRLPERPPTREPR